MTDDISDALERLQLRCGEAISDDVLDNLLQTNAPRVQRTRDPAALKAHLENKYLAPPQHFSAEWLNKLQQYVDRLLLQAKTAQSSPIRAGALSWSNSPWDEAMTMMDHFGLLTASQTMGRTDRLHRPLQNRPYSNAHRDAFRAQRPRRQSCRLQERHGPSEQRNRKELDLPSPKARLTRRLRARRRGFLSLHTRRSRWHRSHSSTRGSSPASQWLQWWC